MPPMIAMNSRRAAQVPRSDAKRSGQATGSPAGSVRPYARRTVAMYMTIASRPGTTPAMNSRPTSCSVMKP